MVVKLARQSVEEYVRNGKVLTPSNPLVPELAEKAGVFVCIKKREQLRGCIGTFIPCSENIAMETIRNAISAATQDPRFPPVTKDELDELAYSVDVLTPPEKVENQTELDPKKFGVIVVSGQKRGLLLPDLDGVDSVDEQLRIARLKGAILPEEKIEIFRFTVKRFR